MRTQRGQALSGQVSQVAEEAEPDLSDGEEAAGLVRLRGRPVQFGGPAAGERRATSAGWLPAAEVDDLRVSHGRPPSAEALTAPAEVTEQGVDPLAAQQAGWRGRDELRQRRCWCTRREASGRWNRLVSMPRPYVSASIWSAEKSTSRAWRPIVATMGASGCGTPTVGRPIIRSAWVKRDHVVGRHVEGARQRPARSPAAEPRRHRWGAGTAAGRRSPSPAAPPAATGSG